MKTKIHNLRAFPLAVALVLASSSAWSQAPTTPPPAAAPAAGVVPMSVNAPAPTTPSAGPALITPGAPTTPGSPTDPNATPKAADSMPALPKEAPTADAVLEKLKQNTSPVTVGDMIQAQDVMTRLDLIGQIEDKMAKIEDARNKRMPAAPPTPAPAAMPTPSAQDTMAALQALKQATPASSSMPSMTGPANAQVLTVSGTDGDYSALIMVDGHQLNVRAGNTIPGLGTIKSIDSKEIVITKKDGKSVNLGFTQN